MEKYVFDNKKLQEQLEEAKKNYEPKVYMDANGGMIVQYQPKWIEQVDIYCNFFKITPMQLIQQHMELTSKIVD